MSILKLEGLPALKLLRSLYLQVPQEPAGKQGYLKLNVEHLTSMCLFPIYFPGFPCVSQVFPRFPMYFPGFPGISLIFPRYFSGISLGISRVNPGYFPNISQVFPWYFPGTSQVFPRYFPCIPRYSPCIP